MGIPSLEFQAQPGVWRCRECATHLANGSDLISDDFRGERGRAKLFAHVSNCKRYGRRRSLMSTGEYLIEKIRCFSCAEYVGWTYLVSYEPSEEYKVGKFILEVDSIEYRDF